MGIRENLNKNPVITMAAAALVIVVSVVFILRNILGGSEKPKMITQYYYSADDGATYFADDHQKIPPFSTDKGQAVRAHVFKCEGGQPFVGYLERYTDIAKEQMEAARTKDSRAYARGMEEFESEHRLVRKPGSAEGPKWVPSLSPNNQKLQEMANQIQTVKCKDGAGNPIEVYPE